jgi:hypothetical protein
MLTNVLDNPASLRTGVSATVATGVKFTPQIWCLRPNSRQISHIYLKEILVAANQHIHM